MTDALITSPQMSGDTVSFIVNGRAVTVAGDHPHLLSALREELNITSAKTDVHHRGNADVAPS